MTLSPRLAAVLAALPLTHGLRVLEIGCGPGALARAMADRIGDGFVLGIDRSATAIEQARAGGRELIADERLAFRVAAVETFTLGEGEAPFDLAVGIRVGVLDGRHPEGAGEARARLRAALRPDAPVLIDGGDPLRSFVL